MPTRCPAHRPTPTRPPPRNEHVKALLRVLAAARAFRALVADLEALDPAGWPRDFDGCGGPGTWRSLVDDLKDATGDARAAERMILPLLWAGHFEGEKLTARLLAAARR